MTLLCVDRIKSEPNEEVKQKLTAIMIERLSVAEHCKEQLEVVHSNATTASASRDATTNRQRGASSAVASAAAPSAASAPRLSAAQLQERAATLNLLLKELGEQLTEMRKRALKLNRGRKRK